MISFGVLGLNFVDIILLILIVIGSFFLTCYLFPKYIKFAKIKGWIGNDIHKKARPEVAESGGLVFLIGIIPAFIAIIIIFPEIRNESIVFLVTMIFSGIIGFIDDRIVLPSIKKMALMIGTGIPIFILNWFGYFEINSIIIPILGQTQLTIIYPLVVPIIIMVLTNAVNMLEGYNGEGSGTTFIVLVFMLIYSIISGSSEGLIYSLGILGALAAFVKFNRFPAKVFPGDVGTLIMGAAIACIAIFGSIEVAMFCAILPHIFNGFYVIASLRGLKERHTITTKDIFVDEQDLIHASVGKEDHLTLPRLIVAHKSMTEKELVNNFWVLAFIGGLFGIVAEIVKGWTLGNIDIIWIPISLSIIAVFYFILILKFKAIMGISVFMIALLIIGLGFLVFIDAVVVESVLNWLYAGILAGIGFLAWYILSIKFFWYKISKLKNR